MTFAIVPIGLYIGLCVAGASGRPGDRHTPGQRVRNGSDQLSGLEAEDLGQRAIELEYVWCGERTEACAEQPLLAGPESSGAENGSRQKPSSCPVPDDEVADSRSDDPRLPTCDHCDDDIVSGVEALIGCHADRPSFRTSEIGERKRCEIDLAALQLAGLAGAVVDGVVHTVLV